MADVHVGEIDTTVEAEAEAAPASTPALSSDALASIQRATRERAARDARRTASEAYDD
jgi:hypothetical protein